MTLAESVYALARQLEPHDRFVLGAQLQRTVVSTPSNIAEGWGRGTGRVLALHLRIALGSEAELQTQLELAMRVGVIAAADGDRALTQTSEVGRMLRGMLASTLRRAKPDS
jgi:four helix bundle protein